MESRQIRTCGARTRRGGTCKNTRLYSNGRCKNHGGPSTGPRTRKGRMRALANLKGVDAEKVLARDAAGFEDMLLRGRAHVMGSVAEAKVTHADISSWFDRGSRTSTDTAGDHGMAVSDKDLLSRWDNK